MSPYKCNWIDCIYLVTHLCCFSVIRLRLAKTTGVTPVPGVSLRGGTDLGSGTRPEPAVYVRWLQVGSVASRKVTFPSGSPNVPDVAPGKPLLDELVLLRRLQGDGVHTMSSADISGVQPIYFEVAGRSVFPTEEVGVGHTTGISVVGMTHP